MKIIKIFITFLMLINFTSANADEDKLQSKITKNLRCLTEKQIYEFLTKKYGEWILYDPQINKNTYLMWFLPLLIFLFGGAIIFKKTVKKKIL